MFVTPAYAQSAAASDPFTSLLIPMLLMLAIFYFLLIRPQSKRAKEHQERVNSVRRGDTVITSGGMVGRVTKVTESTDDVEVELAENLKVRIVKSTLMDVRSKNDPVKSE